MKKLETVVLYVRSASKILEKLGSRQLTAQKNKKKNMERMKALPTYMRNRIMRAYRHAFRRELDKFLISKGDVTAISFTRKEITFLAREGYYIRNGILTIC